MPSSSSGQQSDRLGQYRAKRDFGSTPEPAGSHGSAGTEDALGKRRFVVQRHRARRLHYDFRLEVAGVLASWAVPKGPTLDPSARHLAVHVEDHPIEYYDFEGVIPAGEYGGGDVIVWDWGAWAPVDETDPAQAIESGELHFDLWGERLVGRFVLVRTGRRGDRRQWLLLHKRDDHAVAGWDPEQLPRSVKSGRTNDEVADAPESLWRGDRPAAEARIDLPSTGTVSPTPPWDPVTDDEIAALEGLGGAGEWVLAGRPLKLTNLDKVLFPGRGDDAPLTKRHLIRYHTEVAPYLLPYLTDRPLNLHRYPDGVDRPGFWHKEVPGHAPDWLRRWHNDEADPGETEWYAVADHPAALAWLANYGAVELHAWTSTVADVHQPTWAFIDIDPGPHTSFDDVVVLARLYRTALDHLGAVGMPKVTGQRGIQIWVPIRRGYRFDQTRAWVEKVSRAIGETVPELVSWAWQKQDREGRARLDYTQNAINKTLVAPFSARPAAGAPVSVPIAWDELDDPDLRPDRWTIRTVFERLEHVGDPLAALIGWQQELPSL